jgi:SAM-dependent methyltransferase
VSSGERSNDPLDLQAGTEEHYEDAALYDFEYRRRRADVNWYRQLARRLAPGGPILELGCGTGRVLAPLARDGHLVVGVDLAQTMLVRARARVEALGRVARTRVRLVRADMRELALALRFPLVICPFNAFQHMYARRDVEAALARVREHLAPGGHFAFDVLNPDLRWLTRDPNKRWAKTRFRHPETGLRYEYSTNQDYDRTTQIAHMRIYYERLDVPPEEKRTHVVRLAHRQFFPAELWALLAHAGFRVDERWGGFAEEPFDDDSDSQVLVCSVPAAETT